MVSSLDPHVFILFFHIHLNKSSKVPRSYFISSSPFPFLVPAIKPLQNSLPLAPHNLISSQGTPDVRLDPQLNKKVWESGIKGVPFRLRVRISRKRNDEEGAKEKLYSYVQAVNVKEPRGMVTVVVEDT